MCTVNKDWSVQQLYPHITKLYKQVTEDQDNNNNNNNDKDKDKEKCEIQITTLKKNTYYIPKSQIVGEVFVDGD